MSFQSLSHQFDATRQEIIAKYRARIEQQKRTKLTKLELEELIDIFITRLQSLNNKQDIQQLCILEIDLLEEGYPTASVAKNHLPLYRKAIAVAIEDGRISLNEQNSHFYTYIKDEAEHVKQEHWALTYLKYDRATYEKIAMATTSHNNLKQDSLQPVNLQLYLETVDSLFHSSHPLDLAIAIAATSGRRYSEVMARGKLTSSNHPYQVCFSGQLKKRTAHAPSQGACGQSKQRTLDAGVSPARESVGGLPTAEGGQMDEAYTSYTLLPAVRVLNALEQFRSHPEIAAISEASIEEINSLNTPLNRKVKKYFQDTGIVPVLMTEEAVTIQNLRSIYGEIAVHFFCPPSVATHRFVQQKLGHIISESALLTRKNSSSTEHYFHYYLVDDRGKHLADKGVLLNPSLSSPLTLQQNERRQRQSLANFKSEKEMHLLTTQNRPTLNQETLDSAEFADTSLLQFTVDEEQSVPSNDFSVPTISLSQARLMNQPSNQPHKSETSNKIQAIPPYLHSRLSDLADSMDLSPAETIEKSFQWAEMGIALAGELELESINPHAVFEQVQALARQQTFSDDSNNNLNLAELTAAKEQVAALTRSLDRVTELFYQAQAKLNSNPTTWHQTSTVPALTTSPPAPIKEHTYPSTTDSSQSQTKKKTPHFSSPKSNHVKRKRDSSQTVKEDINHAIDAIIEFNNTPNRPQEQKFYIGVGAVRELTSRGDITINDVLEQRQEEIQQHLKQHQLDQSHNLSRRDSDGYEYPSIGLEPELPYQKITYVSN